MARLIRLLAYAAGAYLFFRVGYPEAGPLAGYHSSALPVIAGGAAAVVLLCAALKLASGMAVLGVELAFAAGVFVYLGATMPQLRGRSALSQLLSGEYPARAARAAAERLPKR